MRTPVILTAFSFGLLACSGFCQTSIPNDPLGGRSLVISAGPILQPPAQDYENFFQNVKYFGNWPLSAEGLRLQLTNEEIRSLVSITVDLADESLFFHRIWSEWKFESLMEVVDRGSSTRSVEEKLRDLQDQWAQKVLDHVRRLQAALGEPRFREVDEFIHSGRSMFTTPKKVGVVKSRD
jgi:hypothetical protein